MEKSYEKDRGGAIYRSRDPIKNFKIRVKLKRLSCSTLGFLGQEDIDSNTDLSTTNQFGQTILEQEELTIQWQQKFFSQREIEFYDFEPNCTSVTDYKYHAEVQKAKNAGGRPNRRIFTYVDKDRFSLIDTAYEPMTTSNDETPTYLNDFVTEVRRRKQAEKSSGLPTWDKNRGVNATGMKLVEKEPNEEFKQNHHIINTPVRTFVIMADCSPEGQLGSAEFERHLCIIEYDDNFVLRVIPDFTRSKPPYRIEDGVLRRDVWEYEIEHTSNDVSKMEARREAKVIGELYQKHQNYLQSLVGEEFEETGDGIFRLLVYGEFVSAESFEYDHLHIEYFLDLPKNWSCDPTQLLSGCTHSCRTTLTNNVDRAYFSHPFNYQMFLALDSDDVDVEWPKMFLHVISSDDWGRRRTEGYGYFSLPSTPGIHNVNVQCWRPLGNGAWDSTRGELQRFFVGGNPELEDVTFAAIPSTFEGSRLSKYGVKTESTGSVTLRLNCMQQCQGYQDSTSMAFSKKKLQNTLKLKSRPSEETIHGVMGAYQRARKRMQLAREKVPTHVKEKAQKSVAEKLQDLTLDDKVNNVLGKSEKQD